MSKIGIVTDSSSCLPPELATRYGILVAPTNLVIGKKEYRDIVDITTSEFWNKFREFDGHITTSAVSPGNFLGKYKELAKTVDSIICCTLSAKLSATFQSAVQAKQLAEQELPNLKIEVIDTKTSIGGLSFIVIEASKAAESEKVSRK